jgi:HPt (histidine-containing phosphotransfer) domain-containing protein
MTDSTQNRPGINALVAQIWRQKKDVTLSRVAMVEEASAALLSGALAPDLRGQAAMESHKLAGSLGTFGFPEGSRLAREIEGILMRESDLDRDDGKQLAQLLQELRRQLDQLPQPPSPAKKKENAKK